jgi:hypothetical protein
VTFEEAMLRAQAAHVKARTFRQPGNEYRLEHRCKCGKFVFDVNWNQHVVNAADRLLAVAPPLGGRDK